MNSGSEKFQFVENIWGNSPHHEAVQKDPSSKAAGLLARGAYTKYVSTTTDRERS